MIVGGLSSNSVKEICNFAKGHFSECNLKKKKMMPIVSHGLSEYCLDG